LTFIATVTGPAGQLASGAMSNCQAPWSNVAASVPSALPSAPFRTAETLSPSWAPSIVTSPNPQSLRVK
jgi:hypothetical protein